MIVDVRTTDSYDIYIGRGSRWGNPFPISDKCPRKLAIAKYEVWIRRRPDLLAALPELAGKILGCYCPPLPCHGEVLLRLLREIYGLS